MGTISSNNIYIIMNWYNIYITANKASYGWACVHAPKNIGKKTIEFSKSIPKREMFTEQEGWETGIEDKPHVTVLYGFETTDVKKVENAIAGEKGGTITLGAIDCFTSVLKLMLRT